MRLAWYPFLILLAWPVMIAVHELGHATAAKLLALQFESLRVGPIELRRDDGRWRLAWARVVWDDGVGAFTGRWVELPRSWVGFAALAIGGPLACAASACACAAAAIGLGDGHTLGTAIAADALWMAAGVGGFDAIANLVPRRTHTDGALDDGSRLALAFRFGRRAGHLVVRFLAARQLGRRPRDFGLDAAECLAASETMPRFRHWLLLAALYIANDRGDTALARKVLARALAVTPTFDALRAEFELAQALDDALGGDPAAARAHLRRLGWLVMYLSNPNQVALAEAAIFTAEASYEKARAALERWDRAVKKEGAHMRVGKEWAEEALRMHLAAAASRWRN